MFTPSGTEPGIAVREAVILTLPDSNRLLHINWCVLIQHKETFPLKLNQVLVLVRINFFRTIKDIQG